MTCRQRATLRPEGGAGLVAASTAVVLRRPYSDSGVAFHACFSLSQVWKMSQISLIKHASAISRAEGFCVFHSR